MGEAKRRSQLDPSWGKLSGLSIQEPRVTYLTESNPEYKVAKSLKIKVYPHAKRVFLVKVDYSDSESYVGVVNLFLSQGEITANSVFVCKKSASRDGKQVMESILKLVGSKAKNEWFKFKPIYDE